MTQPNSVPVLPRRYFPVDAAVGNGAMHGDLEIAPDSSAPDSWLMKYCADLVEVERQLDRAFEVKRPTHAQKRHTTELDYKAASLRLSIVTIRATTLAGHRARALAFLRVDCGRLLANANAREGFENRMLVALVCDLLQLPGQPLPGDKAQEDGQTTESATAGQQASVLEAAIGAAIAHARKLGEHGVAEELTASLELARSRHRA